MWLWWIVSLIILLSSIIFSLYIFYGSYKISPLKKDISYKKEYSLFKNPISITRQQVINSLKLKLQMVENNSLLYFQELKKLQLRINALEKNKPAGGNVKTGFENENWEELYYDVSDKKEKIENELDLSNQKLEEAESLMTEFKRREKLWKEKRSDLENELNKTHSLQNKIGDLKRQLEGAAERELELQQQLQTQQELYKDYELLQQQCAFAQSEADDLRNRIKEINCRDILLQQKINRLTELESTVEISEYEKNDIRKSIEEIILENEALSAKLQDLQDKLNVEKFV